MRSAVLAIMLATLPRLAAAQPKVAADVGELEVRGGHLDVAVVRGGLAAMLPRAAACATAETWSTYMALLTLNEGAVASISSSKQPIMTRDPRTKRWGVSNDAQLAACVTAAVQSTAFDRKAGSGTVSLFLSLHPRLAHAPEVTIASVTSDALDTKAAARAVEHERAELTACFVPRWWLSPIMEGKVTMTATVDADGRISDATAADPPMKTLAACFAEQLQTIKLAAKAGQLAIVLELHPGS